MSAALELVQPVEGTWVRLVDEPTGDPLASWDAFWAEKRGPSETTVIRGVTVLIPVSISLRDDAAISQIGGGTEAWATAARMLLRAPNGTEIPDLYEQWVANGIEIDELKTVVVWALTRARGEVIDFATAYTRMWEAEGEAGKAPANGTSPAATGGPSRRRSRRKGSTQTPSPA